MPIVKLVYEDITYMDNEALINLEDKEPLTFTIIGELLCDDTKKVIVGTEICSDRTDEQSAYYIIPKGCVTHMEIIE